VFRTGVVSVAVKSAGQPQRASCIPGSFVSLYSEHLFPGDVLKKMKAASKQRALSAQRYPASYNAAFLSPPFIVRPLTRSDFKHTLEAFTAVLSLVFCPYHAVPLDCTFLALAPPLPLYPSPRKCDNSPFPFILLPSPHPVIYQPFINSSKHPFLPRVSLTHHPPLFARLHPTTTTWVSPLPSSLFPRLTHLHSVVSLHPG
jgi:hypothetical protein